MANPDPNDVPSCVPLAEESQFGGAKDLRAIVLEIEMFRSLLAHSSLRNDEILRCGGFYVGLSPYDPTLTIECCVSS